MNNLISAFDLVYLDKYEKIVRDAMTALVPFYNKVSVAKEKFVGKSLKFSFVTGENWGGGARNETDPWPDSVSMDFAQGTVDLKYAFHRLNFGIVASKRVTTPGALVNMVARVISGTLKTAKIDRTRMFAGDGTGKVADVTAVSGNTLTVTNIHHFWPGQRIFVFYFDDPNYVHREKTATPVIDFFVRSVDRDLGTIVVGSSTADDAGDIAVDDVIYMKDAVTLTAGAIVSKEWNGIRQMISNTGTFHGINRDTNPWFKSYVNTAVSNRAISVLLLQTFFQKITHTFGRELPSDIACSPGVFRAFVKMLTDANQPVEAVVSKIGYAKGVAYVHNGKKVVVWDHISVPENELWGLSKSDLVEFPGWPLQFVREGGVLQKSSTYPELDAFLTEGGNFGSKSPFNLCKMDKITES